MRLALTSPEEALDNIGRRLMDDWIVVMGDSAAIEHFEGEVYPPGTKHNLDFELILLNMVSRSVFLARKTERFRRYLENPDYFDGLLAMFMVPVEGRMAASLKGYDPSKISKIEAVDKVVEEVRHLTGVGGRPV